MFGKLFNNLKNGLTKTKNALTDKINETLKLAITIDEDLYEELEEILIMADIGMDTTMEIIDRLNACTASGIKFISAKKIVNVVNQKKVPQAMALIDACRYTIKIKYDDTSNLENEIRNLLNAEKIKANI